MHMLNSKNYAAVYVYIRGYDEPLEMNPNNGTKLMQYLSSPKDMVGMFVSLTDVSGEISVIRTSEILRVVPVQQQPKLEDYT